LDKNLAKTEKLLKIVKISIPKSNYEIIMNKNLKKHEASVKN